MYALSPVRINSISIKFIVPGANVNACLICVIGIEMSTLPSHISNQVDKYSSGKQIWQLSSEKMTGVIKYDHI